jgi:putative endonuclease
MPADRSWFVYLIECIDGSIYTGIAVDVAARFDAHCAGKGARYTRAHPPLRLLASALYPDRSAASQEEYRIKQLSPAAKRAYADILIARENRLIPCITATVPEP